MVLVATICRFFLIWALFVLGPLALLGKIGFVTERILAKTSIVRDKDNGYSSVVPLPPLFIDNPDRLGDAARSDLRLFEDDRELGPAHSLHDSIRSKGGGLFSHWGDSHFGDQVVFSSSDGTDPKVNGHTYRVRFRIHPTLNGELLALLGVPSLMASAAILLAGAKWLFPRLARKGESPIALASPHPADEPTGETLRAATAAILPLRPERVVGWAALYAIVITTIYCSMAAQISNVGSLTINFEYRVF